MNEKNTYTPENNISQSDTINRSIVSKYITTDFIGRNIFTYDETDTTNNRAKENFTAPDGSVFTAEVQTNGKGSKGRSWSSERDSGLYCSILLKPDIPPVKAPQITLTAGLAVCKAIGCNSMIKWPNDVVINGKKVCGILTEMSADKDKINYVVCGIGINVNNTAFTDELADKATSLLTESGQRHDKSILLARVFNEFEHCYKKFLNGGLDGILDEYKQNCVTLGREVNVIYQKERIRGKAVDINNDGSLTVEANNEIINVTYGDVSVRGIYGYV